MSSFVTFFTSKIRNKLVLAFLVVALLPLLFLSVVANNGTKKSLMNQAFAQLDAVRQVKANQTQQYFQFINNQITTFSENTMVVDAMRAFPAALATAREENGITAADLKRMETEVYAYYSNDFATEYMGHNEGETPPLNDQFALLDDDSLYLQYLYIKSNPNPLGSKEILDRASDESTYSDLHGNVHPVVRNFVKKFGYQDIFLCDLDSGDIVYSVHKELDYSTSLKDGPYANTNFGRAFKLAAETNAKDAIFFVDFESYTPSYEQAASFISSPIFDGDEKIGVAVFQVPIDQINEIMAERTGLGKTGETYAVGSDFLFRNDSRFLTELDADTTIINPDFPVATKAVKSALNGGTGLEVITDYRGTSVLSSWSPVTVHSGEFGGEPVTWALVSEFSLAEVRRPDMARNLWLIIGLTTLGLIGISLYVSKNITKQANSITYMLSKIGMGDFSARAEIISKDELGQVAGSINAMCDNTLSLIQSNDERQQLESSIQNLRKEMEEIAQGDLTAEAEVGKDISGEVAVAVNDMVVQLRQIIHQVKTSTLQVSSSATQIQSTTAHLSEGSEAQAKQIADTSSAVIEMTESIHSVAKNTEESAQIAQDARKRAADGAQVVSATIDGMGRIRNQVQETSKRIKRLGESSQEIGEIVQLIGDIADRTSILALNASIQAAMAGDAGQGFAVVAEEVERLAERSNEAAKQVESLIKAIQNEATEAIAGMEESTREVVEGSKLAAQAGQTLTDIDAVSNQLAELIGSISQATKQQARGAEVVSKSMNEISQVTQQTATGTSQAAVSVSHLAELADDLRSSVSRFRLPGDTTEEVAADEGKTIDKTSIGPTFTDIRGTSFGTFASN